jgi:hypothetical protein
MNDANDEDRFYDKHAALLGHVTLAWNDCQSMIIQIFHTLSGTSWDRSTSVFLALKSDHSQRNITVALLQTVLDRAEDADIRHLGKSLVDQLATLAGERNAATHTMWVTVMPSRKVQPHPWVPKPKALKPDFKSQFEDLTRKLRDLFRKLLDYEESLRMHLGQTRKKGENSVEQR